MKKKIHSNSNAARPIPGRFVKSKELDTMLIICGLARVIVNLHKNGDTDYCAGRVMDLMVGAVAYLDQIKKINK